MRGFELVVDRDPTLLLAEARFAEHLAALIDASRKHLDRYEAWAAELAEVPAARAMLQSGMAGFLTGTNVPTLLVTGGDIAGFMSIRIDVPNRSGTLGYWLGTGYTGRGLATRAARAVTRFAFDELRLVRVAAHVAVDNGSSRGVLQRAGFVREGLLRSGQVVRGTPADAELWSITPADLPE